MRSWYRSVLTRTQKPNLNGKLCCHLLVQSSNSNILSDRQILGILIACYKSLTNKAVASKTHVDNLRQKEKTKQMEQIRKWVLLKNIYICVDRENRERERTLGTDSKLKL